MTDIVDADVVDDPGAEPEPATALVHRPRVTHEVLTPLNVADQKAAMTAYQQGLQQILDGSDWQDAGRGERFVKKSGWRKIAAWFNLSIELVRDEVERDENGQPTRATVWARAVAPNGRFADGDGHCAVDERRFERNKGKLENDLRGTAATRATNRAISNLVGMGAVSAEEVDTTGQQPAAERPAADPGLSAAASTAVLSFANGDMDAAKERWAAIKRACAGACANGALPQDVALALCAAAGTPAVPDVPPTT